MHPVKGCPDVPQAPVPLGNVLPHVLGATAVLQADWGEGGLQPPHPSPPPVGDVCIQTIYMRPAVLPGSLRGAEIQSHALSTLGTLDFVCSYKYMGMHAYARKCYTQEHGCVHVELPQVYPLSPCQAVPRC